MSNKFATFKMLSGYSIPLTGLGTYLIEGDDVLKTLDKALAVGYRAFDTAAMYGNEKDIGSALKELLPKHNLNREDIFIQTKLNPSDHGNVAKTALEKSLKNLQCGYLDLYLIHWPGSYTVSSRSEENLKLRTASWATLVEAKEAGLVRSLGVSNYIPRHLNQLLSNCYGVKPVLNQMEWHPGCYDNELKQLCDKEGILLQAYMPLGGNGNLSLLRDNVVTSVAKQLGKTPAQVLLRWCLQQNVAVIPKGRSMEHLKDNLETDFIIPESDMKLLNNIDKVRFDWNPYSVL
ncbi:hypothetical protein RI129_001366 [Pyrocoelia pectoralis]|uniref:NADP-dependent oxidoreductase domain-containing protein n=1 Tax=Pyrocoelia pectoralis TaxID=417401 RepID=A0AAN7VKL7_9COLE